MHRISSLIVLVAAIMVIVVGGTARAVTPEPIVKEFSLKNGMHFLVLERHQFPTISCVVFFNVGAADEPSGKTGMAHLLEHLIFKGTKDLGTTDWSKEEPIIKEINSQSSKLIDQLDQSMKDHPPGILQSDSDPLVTEEMKQTESRIKELLEQERNFMVKEEFSAIYSRHGGEWLNAFTSYDYTGYIILLPKNKLELWSIMESARMKDPIFREFYPERDVVMEELRMGDESSPESQMYRSLSEMMFPAHPYGRPIVGYWDDLRHLRYEDIENFAQSYYKPNNAVAVISGDVTVDEVRKFAEKYFEPIAPGLMPSRHRTDEPPMNGRRDTAVEFDAQPQMLLAWRTPGPRHPDFPAMDVASSVLGTGASSRLHKSLVLEKKVATSVECWIGERSKDPESVVIGAVPYEGHSLDDIEKLIQAEIDRLKSNPPDQRELEKVKNQINASAIFRLDQPLWLNSWLAGNYLVFGDWREGYRYLDRIQAVTGEEVMKVVQKYFVPENMGRVTLRKKEAAHE